MEGLPLEKMDHSGCSMALYYIKPPPRLAL
jgi:hypothetical protein